MKPALVMLAAGIGSRFGGLKQIEQELNIKRPDELELLRGHNAVELWKMWRVTADRHYLDLLLKYNQEDVINLRQIADYSVKELWSNTFDLGGL